MAFRDKSRGKTDTISELRSPILESSEVTKGEVNFHAGVALRIPHKEEDVRIRKNFITQTEIQTR